MSPLDDTMRRAVDPPSRDALQRSPSRNDSRTLQPFSAPGSYRVPTYSYPASYHLDYRYYTLPPSAPLVPRSLDSSRFNLPPHDSYDNGHPVPAFVRPFNRELPRVGRTSEHWNQTESGNTTPHRVVTRPLIAKNRIITANTPTYAVSEARTGPRQPLTRTTMDSPARTHSLGKKRKSSFDGDQTDVKPNLERLTSERHTEDETIIPGVALNGSSTFSQRPSLVSRPSGSNVSLSSSPGRTTATPGFPSRQSVTPRGFAPTGVSNGTINPNARGLGGDGQGPLFSESGSGDGMNRGTSENGGDKLKRKKPRVALSCAQCTKVSTVFAGLDDTHGFGRESKSVIGRFRVSIVLVSRSLVALFQY